eukprot:4916801-Prorocentrum_lima.AAC.1
MGLLRIRDTIKKDGSKYTFEDLIDDADERFTSEDDGWRITRTTFVSANALWRDWREILAQIPTLYTRAAKGRLYTMYSPEAVRIMRLMGWNRGQGIGKTPGITAPPGLDDLTSEPPSS